MDPWVLKDGTIVRLGGVVSGDSPEAEAIRQRFSRVRKGEYVASMFGAIPDLEPLDLDAPHLIDCWLRFQYGPDMVSGPEVEYPVTEPGKDPGKHVVE